MIFGLAVACRLYREIYRDVGITANEMKKKLKT